MSQVIPDSLAKWEINVTMDGIIYNWHGGPYIEVVVNGESVDVINVWDYQNGKTTVRTVNQLIGRIRQYVLAHQEAIDER
jgi:hypothetical protein